MEALKVVHIEQPKGQADFISFPEGRKNLLCCATILVNGTCDVILMDEPSVAILIRRTDET
ncbi:MAG: hypothetical protein ACLRR3_04310 [Eubacterium sp.]